MEPLESVKLADGGGEEIGECKEVVAAGENVSVYERVGVGTVVSGVFGGELATVKGRYGEAKEAESVDDVSEKGCAEATRVGVVVGAGEGCCTRPGVAPSLEEEDDERA